MKDFLIWLFDLINGYKTYIGAIVTATVTYLYNEMIIDNYTAIFIGTVSVILFGAGVAHKTVKYRKKVK